MFNADVALVTFVICLDVCAAIHELPTCTDTSLLHLVLTNAFAEMVFLLLINLLNLMSHHSLLFRQIDFVRFFFSANALFPGSSAKLRFVCLLLRSQNLCVFLLRIVLTRRFPRDWWSASSNSRAAFLPRSAFLWPLSGVVHLVTEDPTVATPSLGTTRTEKVGPLVEKTYGLCWISTIKTRNRVGKRTNGIASGATKVKCDVIR